jgi:flagellar biosynthesis/type III secretory pathway protein FliH
MPFTFSDLGVDCEERLGADFICLFSRPTVEAPEKPKQPEHREELVKEEAVATPPPSPEDQARKAFEDAYVEGEKAGYEMGMRRVDSLAKRLEKHIVELTSFRKDLEERYGKLAVDLALSFAEALVLRECQEKREILGDMVGKALEACEDRNEIVIRVRTEDFQYVRGAVSPRLRVVADDTLNEPGFIVETSVGDIDGRISSQIDELKNALLSFHAG